MATDDRVTKANEHTHKKTKSNNYEVLLLDDAAWNTHDLHA